MTEFGVIGEARQRVADRHLQADRDRLVRAIRGDKPSVGVVLAATMRRLVLSAVIHPTEPVAPNCVCHC